MTFQVSDASQKASPVPDGSDNQQLNSVDILQPSQSVESTNNTDTINDKKDTAIDDQLIPNVTFDSDGEDEFDFKDEKNYQAPKFTLDENGTGEIVGKGEEADQAPEFKLDNVGSGIVVTEDGKTGSGEIVDKDGTKFKRDETGLDAIIEEDGIKFKIDENGTGEITSKDESKPYPPSLELIDEPKEKSLESKTPLTEAEQKAFNKLKEAIDSADFEDIYKTVKQFTDNPKGLEKISQALAKELKPYGMTAKVEYPQNDDGSPNTKNPSEANLVLSQMYDSGDELHKDSISFTTKPGADAFQRQTSEAKDGSGGGGGGGPLRPSANGQEGTVSHVLRRMSHDRTH